MKKTYTLLGIIAVVALLAYAFIPTLLFEEVIYPLDKGIALSAYDDRDDGGNSSIVFEDKQNQILFECSLGEDSLVPAWCGLLWNFDPDSIKKYKNWIFVDSIIFEMDVKNTEEVLLKIWTYDPDVTDIKVPKSFRLLMKELPLHEGLNRVALSVSDLYTPDFWYLETKTSKELRRKHEETVARIEIAPGWNQKRGVNFSLNIYSIKVKGVSNFLFGVVLVIFVFLMIIAVGYRHKGKTDEEKK